jgi:hypothetical protein
MTNDDRAPNVSSQASLKLDLLCNPNHEAYEVISARLSGSWIPRGCGNKARKRASERFNAVIAKRGIARATARDMRVNRYAVTGK